MEADLWTSWELGSSTLAETRKLEKLPELRRGFLYVNKKEKLLEGSMVCWENLMCYSCIWMVLNVTVSIAVNSHYNFQLVKGKY